MNSAVMRKPMGSHQESESPVAGVKTLGSSRAGWVLLGAAALLAAASVAYNLLDSRESDQPPVAAAEGLPDIADLQARAEASQDDAGPWSELAFARFERGEFAEAATAYERAVQIDPNEAVLWSALGEARVMAVDAASAAADPLPPSAIAAFEKALKLDPSDPRARYFLAVKKDLGGDPAAAIADWLALLGDTPPGAPWEENLVRTIEQVAAINEIDVSQRLAAARDGRMPVAVAPTSLRGPTAQEIAAAGSIPPEQQRQMAEGMVANLETRLQREPDDLDGWVMLMRSRMTLGEPAKARAALNAAIVANPGEAAELRRQAAALGIR